MAKRAAIAEQIRAAEERERAKARKLDTRRKILAGAAVLEEADRRPEYQQELIRLLERFLVRPDDRKLFDLPEEAAPGTVVERANTIELIERVGEATAEVIRAA